MKIIMRNYNANADYGEVYRLFTDFDVNGLVINKTSYNSMSVFAKWLDDKLNREFNDFMVFRSEADEFIGFAYSYDFQHMNGHCLFTIAIKSKFQNVGLGGFVSYDFLKYLFKNYNLRKVYIHVYDYNIESRKAVESFGFTLEGVLKEYRYYDGRFADLRIYSVERMKFYQKIEQYENKVYKRSI